MCESMMITAKQQTAIEIRIAMIPFCDGFITNYWINGKFVIIECIQIACH